MKREIKFKRAFFFDEEKTAFSHFTEWGIDIRGIHFTSPSTNNFAYYYEDMQYTGLKDKNGVEIYERDIIITDGYVYEVFYHLSLGWDGGGSCHPGFYLKGRAEKIDEDYSELDYHIGFDDCEVIGNVYENPVSI